MTKKKRDAEPLGFEAALARLGSVVEALENDKETLESSLELFEEGVTLVNAAQMTLLAAEQKVSLLLEKRNEMVIEEFIQPEEGE